jgi:hypothetical protein
MIMRHLVLIVTLCTFALDTHEFRLALVVDDEGCKVAATSTSGVEALCVLLNIQPTFAVVAIDDGGAIVLLKLLLLVIPEFFPGCAAVFG